MSEIIGIFIAIFCTFLKGDMDNTCNSEENIDPLLGKQFVNKRFAFWSLLYLLLDTFIRHFYRYSILPLSCLSAFNYCEIIPKEIVVIYTKK